MYTFHFNVHELPLTMVFNDLSDLIIIAMMFLNNYCEQFSKHIALFLCQEHNSHLLQSILPLSNLQYHYFSKHYLKTNYNSFKNAILLTPSWIRSIIFATVLACMPHPYMIMSLTSV